VPEFLTQRQNLLREYSQADELLTGPLDDQTEILRLLFRSAAFYRRVLLVDDGNVVRASYPPAPDAITLSELERAAIADVLRSNSLGTSNAFMSELDGYGVSFIAPIDGPGAAPGGVLVGRTPDVSLNELIVGLQGTMGEGQGFLVDGLGQIIAHPDPTYLLKHWEPPDVNLSALATEVSGVTAYEGRAGISNARQLVAYAPGQTHRWTVVIQVPYTVVLQLALQISTPLMGVLIAAMTVFGFALLYLSNNLTRPLSELVQATQNIAAGNMETPINVAREDEIGQLGLSFSRMQRSLQKRLDELALLLNVSQDVSASIDIKTSMPAILQGAIRGTGAAGVRVVVLNPSGSRPLLFGEGPAAEAMARFDRALMTQAQRQGEIVLATPREVAEQLRADAEGALPVRSLVAMPLNHSQRYLGVLWLGYRQAHTPDRTEIDLLRTLAGQTAMLVVNSHLYTTAEGGRRRLAAVLASTTDAVIVTDQAERVLFVNPAMSRAFGLPGTSVINQPVGRVIEDPALLEAVTGPIARARGTEIAGPDGRVWSANPSNVLNQEGQVLGRVVTMHDITTFKELDELKSEFVRNASHDLRTPLAFMKGYADMLPDIGELNADQREYTERIKHGINVMSHLVETLLDLNRLEGGVELAREPVNVVSMLRDLAVGHEMQARDAGLNLRLEVPASLPTLVGDPGFLHQAVANYLTNAIKYAPNSGDLTLRGQLSEDGREILIQVQDHGPGIAKEHQLRLFEKFYRVRTRGNQSQEGSGLGLAIVRSTAERHGGTAYFESEEGAGATFTIALPIPPPEAPNGDGPIVLGQ
jgi:PAS domain S-box-containing protein